MRRRFDHENLKVHQSAVGFCAWSTPLIDSLPHRVAARDQLDRASTSIVLNLAEGDGKRSYPDRSRYFNISRGSGVECAACFDVLVARFSGEGRVQEEQSSYDGENDKDKE